MSKRRLILISFVIVVLILAALVVSDANQRGEAITQGVQDIIDRQP